MEIRCDWFFDVVLYLKYARQKWLENKNENFIGIEMISEALIALFSQFWPIAVIFAELLLVSIESPSSAEYFLLEAFLNLVVLEELSIFNFFQCLSFHRLFWLTPFDMFIFATMFLSRSQ